MSKCGAGLHNCRLTCARKGDMNSWTFSNFRSSVEESTLRYIPNKTKGSSAVAVEFAPIPKRVIEIFTRNQTNYGKLIPPITGGIGRSIKTILKRYPIFNRDLTSRTPKGIFITNKTYKSIKIHSLRASGISYLLNRGVSEMTVKKYQDIQQTQTCLGFMQKFWRKAKLMK